MESPGGQTFDSQRTLQREAPPDGVLAEGGEVGAYVVRRRLGSGAMGAVYAAWDPRLEREIALKVLHLDGDLLAEARLLAKLSHPNVVAVHEVLSWNGRAVLAMELVHGQTLHDWLKTHTVREKLAVLQQCAEGLEAAHAAGIVHRDFKPANVLVDERGRARLLDFGLALHDREGHGLAGSPAYMPLQQLEGMSATANSDQFAWWVTVHEAVLGRLPHDATTLEGLVEQRRQGRLDLNDVPRWLRASLTRGLSNDPRQRFASMREASRALVPPRRAGWLAAGAVALIAIGAFAWPSASACDALTVKPDSLHSNVPALAAAVTDYAAAQTSCRALPSREQVERAACLDTVGRELDVAIAAADDAPSELAPRVLKRVRPSARCEKYPLPPPSPIEPSREAIIESLKAQLRFDALRQKGDLEGAATLASEHAKAVANSPSPTIRAWAGHTEASGFSMTWRSAQTLQRLRELEGIQGLGPREQAWISIGRWMFECFASSRDHCEVVERQARRAVAVLDEPWANALMLEGLAVTSAQAVPARTLIDAYRQIPGAGFEVERALANELGGAMVSDNRVRKRTALEIADELELTNDRAKQAKFSLEVSMALSTGDLMRVARSLAKLDALPGDGPDLVRTRFEAHVLTLIARGEPEAALALLETIPASQVRGRDRRLITTFRTLTLMKSPRAKEVGRKLELLADEMQEIDRIFYEGALVLEALVDKDAQKLRELPEADGWVSLRAWQLAVLTGDTAAEEALYASEEPDADIAAWFALESALKQGRFEDVVKNAPASRARCESATIEGAMRLAEAWAHWKLGDHVGPCRLVTRDFFSLLPASRQHERLEVLSNECTFLGLTPWPK